MKSLKDRGFTMLELLVVVAILAIIGGGILVAYDEVDDKVSEGVAAHSLASLDSAVRSYTAATRQAPNYLDSLLAADYPADPEDASTALTMSNPGAGRLQIIHDNFDPPANTGKALDVTLTPAQVAALNAAGITHLRYVDSLANDPTNPADGDPPVTLACPDADGGAALSNHIFNIDIPSRVFESARPGNPNRGKGYAKRIGVGDPVLQWNPSRSGGSGGYDNTKLGAAPDDVIFVFGLGNDATCVGASGGRLQMTAAPVYGKNLPHQYARYLLAYNVGPAGNEFSKARLQIVLNTHGDFTDEMISEHGGQKP